MQHLVVMHADGRAQRYLHMCEIGPGARAGVKLPHQDAKGVGICSLHNCTLIIFQGMLLEEAVASKLMGLDFHPMQEWC